MSKFIIISTINVILETYKLKSFVKCMHREYKQNNLKFQSKRNSVKKLQFYLLMISEDWCKSVVQL